jgi:hypothetical protein
MRTRNDGSFGGEDTPKTSKRNWLSGNLRTTTNFPKILKVLWYKYIHYTYAAFKRSEGVCTSKDNED